MPDEATFFFYAGSQKIELELVEDTVAVAFTESIPERRLNELRARARPVDVLGRSPALLSRNVLVHRTGPAARGAARVQAFAERLNRGPSVRFVNHVFRNPANDLHLIPTDEILARFKPDVAQAQIDALNSQHNVEIVEQKAYAPAQYLLRVLNPSPRRIFDVANAYHESDLTEWASPNFVRETRARFIAQQWHLNNTGQHYLGAPPSFPALAPGVAGEDVRANQAWAITQGSGNIVIAILDEGVDTTHPDLQANIVEGGRNFTDPTDPNNPNPLGNDAHGTACAGVAAGIGSRISGIAPGCKILPIKMLGADDNGMADAIHYAANLAQVLSNSWGLDQAVAPVDQAIQDVIATSREGKGAVVLFAVGNNNQPISTGDQSRIDGVIAVGASTNVGLRAGYSNTGESVDNPPGSKRISVLAPSDGTSSNHLWWAGFPADNSTENIYTSDIQAARGYNPQPAGTSSVPEPNVDANSVANFPDYTGLFGGTSSACPLAAGVCALMLSLNADLTAAQIKYILEATADKIGTGQARQDSPNATAPAAQQANYQPNSGHDSRYGFGRVNAERAVKAARGDPILQFDGATYRDAIPVVLRRQPGTNHFVSVDEIEVVDARRDREATPPANTPRLHGAPGGFLRASFQPTGGGPAITDELDIEGGP